MSTEEANSGRSKKPARCGMKTFESCTGDAHKLTHLNAGPVVARHHVWLDHHRHILFKRHLRQRTRGPALAADDRRKVAAAEAVHQVVVDREAAILDHASRINDLLHGRAV